VDRRARAHSDGEIVTTPNLQAPNDALADESGENSLGRDRANTVS
jgi:hypothetical protein